MPRARAHIHGGAVAGALLWAVLLLSFGCSEKAVPSPFVNLDAGQDAGPSDAAATLDSGADPTLGGPCERDAQCDDGVACTSDACDLELQRCRFSPNDDLCQDDVFCDGAETCRPGRGCTDGTPVACSDSDECTIDVCLEESDSCIHLPRDADADGDPVWNCAGTDCNDTDPLVSGLASEVCGNAVDDNCNLAIDEPGCRTAAHDRCSDALEVRAAGNYPLDLTVAANDYSSTCSESSARDVVLALIVPAGGPQDVRITATSTQAVSVAARSQCDNAASELACGPSYAGASGGHVAGIRLRGLAPGAYPVYVFGSGLVQAQVSFSEATERPANETCSTARTLTAGVAEQVFIGDAARDLESACDPALGELVYQFTLPEPRAVTLRATSLDSWAAPTISLRREACALAADEITCRSESSAPLFVPVLPAGTYYVAVSASAPSDVRLLLDVSPPAEPSDDETCVGAPALSPGVPQTVLLGRYSDDVAVTCSTGAPDAAYAVQLNQRSDLLLLGRFADGDRGALSVLKPECQAATDLLACTVAEQSPLRLVTRGLEPGSYRAVVESQRALDARMTAYARPASPPVPVPFADDCASAADIPEQGALLQGNTSNAAADYPVGCDLGGQPPAGAPDQMLRLRLSEAKRVVFDMAGSDYDTLLIVRKGPDCPGEELARACAAGYVPGRSFLELSLEAGDYYVQVDGYAGDSGPWSLNVFSADR